MRASGVLMPVSSIPSKYGIGCFSKEAYEFVDQLAEGGQQYWQILPLGPTGYGDSPYQSFSTYAGNPYFIDLVTLIEDGLLTEDECDSCEWGDSEDFVSYDKQYQNRFKLLRLAFERSDYKKDEEFAAFIEKSSEWLDDYCLYMAIKNSQGGAAWTTWPKELKNRGKRALKKVQTELAEEIDFYRYQQYLFEKQWNKLKAYANENEIKIIGDVPIYVAFDSADAWANPKLFQFDKENMPKAVAGCPPDAFSETGQLWGNPLYNWKHHKKTGYEWWISRMKHSLKRYDVVRIDHFRGFDEYYAIPYGDETAENGKWEKGPGMDLFNTLKKEIEELNVIAEDLGILTDSVLELLKESGFPGMKVLQFAFDKTENSDYLPHKFTSNNCVVYTGTHDNETTKGWLKGLKGHDLTFVREYINCYDKPVNECVWTLIRMAMASTADLAIIPIQDYLCLGNEARINAPSTVGKNWQWRMRKNQISEITLYNMNELTRIYGRKAPKPVEEEEELLEEGLEAEEVTSEE